MGPKGLNKLAFPQKKLTIREQVVNLLSSMQRMLFGAFFEIS